MKGSNKNKQVGGESSSDFRMFSFVTGIQNTIVGFIRIFGSIVARFRDFRVLAFAARIENTVIRVIGVFTAFVIRLCYFCMLTLSTRI